MLLIPIIAPINTARAVIVFEISFPYGIPHRGKTYAINVDSAGKSKTATHFRISYTLLLIFINTSLFVINPLSFILKQINLQFRQIMLRHDLVDE
jgi:hypothetical protein